MADSLSGWVLASLGKGHLILGHRFLSQRVLVLRVLVGSASTYYCLYLVACAHCLYLMFTDCLLSLPSNRL